MLRYIGPLRHEMMFSDVCAGTWRLAMFSRRHELAWGLGDGEGDPKWAILGQTSLRPSQSADMCQEFVCCTKFPSCILPENGTTSSLLA